MWVLKKATFVVTDYTQSRTSGRDPVGAWFSYSPRPATGHLGHFSTCVCSFRLQIQPRPTGIRCEWGSGAA